MSQPSETAAPPHYSLLEGSLVLVVLGIVIITLQLFSGAHDSDLGADPDEPAHYVTGLMIRQFVLSGFSPANPVHFARNYYNHYPKVALGHYPPGFYLTEGAWMLAFGPGRTSVLLFMAATGTVFSFLCYLLLRTQFQHFPSFLGALACSTLPVVQMNTAIVMSDLLLGIFCIAAASALIRYLDSMRTRDSLAFGAFATLAIMTKGSGMLLALLVPAAILLSARFAVLRQPSLWLAPLPVVLICLPWLAMTYHITEEGMAREPMLPYIATAASFFARTIVHVFGPVLLVPATIGAVWLLASAIRNRKRIAPFWAVMLALPACLVALYCLVPGGLDARYLIPAVPSVIALAWFGVRSLASAIAPLTHLPRLPVAAGLAAIIFALFIFNPFRIPGKSVTGYRQAAKAALALRQSPDCRILVASDAHGEGAFIAELAMQEPAPLLTVRRSSKFLSSSDWLGRNYQAAAESPGELLTLLRDDSIAMIIVDDAFSLERRAAHHDLLEQALRSPASPYELRETHDVARESRHQSLTGSLSLYTAESQ